MAIGIGSLIRMSLIQRLLDQEVMNVWDYIVLESSAAITAGNYAEAWWNHVKDDYRAICPDDYGPAFLGVRCVELGVPLGEYGDYSVPTLEQRGTRTPPVQGAPVASFAACGVRLSVGTRVTRPGQKRFAFVTESDSNNDELVGSYVTIISNLMDTMTTNMLLGSPAAASLLVPHVVGFNADGSVRASQAVLSYSVNPYITSQVSRKLGRGS